jgi:hypothetical protein
MKRSFMIAMGIGILISTISMAIPSTNDWAFIELPGMGAAYLFWGAVGESPITGVAIGWAVNAVVYGLVAFVVLIILKGLTGTLPPQSN